jgi:hypothetical protein
MMLDTSDIRRGNQAIANSLSDLNNAGANIVGAALHIKAKVQARKDDDALKDAQADWDIARDRADLGYTDEKGQAVKGIRDYSVEDPARTDAWKKTVTDWRDNPESPYTKLSPRARQEFDRFFSVETNRLFDLASRHDTMIQDERRKQTDIAGLAAAERGVQAYVYNEDLFNPAAEDLADRSARLKAGRMIVNPEETDPAKLQFRDDIKNADGTVSGNTRTVFQAARAETLDKVRHTRAITLADGAGTAEHEGTAAARMDLASKAAETLPPALKTDALSALEAAKGKRLQGMLGLARTQQDLDAQEQLVAAAETAAKTYNAGGKLLGAVTEEANGIRAAAQRMENHTALAALAEGKPYDPESNTRKQAAMSWAKPKFEAMQRAATSRTLSGQEEFIGSMIGAGAWFDSDGSIRAVSLDERRELLRAQMAAGNIRLPDYQQQKARLDKIELSGQKDRYERIAADVCTALGTEIKTVWSDSGTVLKEKEDPSKWIGHYQFNETQIKDIPVTEKVGEKLMPIGGGFTSVPVLRETGRTTEQTTVIRHKRDILARDIPKMIDLLVAAKSADGLMVDLDGNPRTPSVKMNATDYYASLLKDIKNRVLAVDLDSQAAGIFAAVSLRDRERKALEAVAVSRNAKLSLPPAETAADKQNTEDSYDY